MVSQSGSEEIEKKKLYQKTKEQNRTRTFLPIWLSL